MKKREVSNPTVPFTEVDVNGKTFKMCFDYGAIALAEAKFRSEGHRETYLLIAAPEPEVVQNLKFLFACSLQPHHPEIGYEEACALVTPRTQQSIYLAFKKAWEEAMPEPNPPAPEQQAGIESTTTSGPTS